MSIETLFVFISGVLAGVITGILPGIAPTHLLAAVYVWVQDWSPVHLMVFYITYLTISNFVDCIPSLYFGIPGELSAIPASRESKNLNSRGLTMEAIKQTAIGRLAGSSVGIAMSFFVVDWVLSFPEIFASRYQIMFYVFTLVCVAFAGRNSIGVNILMMCGGLIISTIGLNYYFHTDFLTFGWHALHNGVPLLPVLIGLYVLPQLMSAAKPTQFFEIKDCVTTKQNFSPEIARSSVVGYILGLVPGMSYILGSTAAYNLELWISRRWPGKKDPSLSAVVASETASNTGTVSVLIPLLLFGVPIIASEAIIYDLMVDSGAVFQLGKFLTDNYTTIVFWFAMSCVVGFLLSWPLANACKTLAGRLLDPRFSWILVVFILGSLAIDAWQQQKILLYSICLSISFVIGWLLRHKDVMPMVFVIVLGSIVQNVLIVLYQLYF
jgi:putative tricarboxylic transport membrane protein